MSLETKFWNNRFLSHSAFWMVITIYEMVNEGWKAREVFTFTPQLELFSIIPIAMLLSYLNVCVLMPWYYFKRKYLHYAFSFLLLLLVGGALQRYFSYVVWIPLGKLYQPVAYQEDISYYWNVLRILRNAFLFFPIISVHMLLKIMRVDRERERRLREIEKEKKVAEMNLLRAQVNPHFFFNTLNCLYALTLKGSEKAAEVVLRLSDLMHYMLYEASSTTVLLKDEIKHLESYIYIEKMRFEDRIDISFQFSGEIEGKRIYPLLLLPFIENAFKHGATNEMAWITININVTEKTLFLKVENSFMAERKERVNGLGLENVRKRLRLIYGEDYMLIVSKLDGVFEADLKINL